MKRGYLTPPVILILALITLFVAAAIFFNTFLLKGLKKEPTPVSTPTIQPSPKSATDETVYTDQSRSVYTDEGSANWKTYQDEDYESHIFTLKYPSEWIFDVYEGNDYMVITFGEVLTVDHIGKPTPPYPAPNFRVTYYVDTRNLEELANEYDYLVEEKKDILVNDLKAKFINHGGCASANCANVLLEKDNTVYNLSIPENANDQKLMNTFNQILSTFKFVE